MKLNSFSDSSFRRKAQLIDKYLFYPIDMVDFFDK